jgi:hypothetical protein
MPVPDQEAIQRGRDFETLVAENFGGRVQPGSGNKFYARGDVVSHGLGISCKSELNLTWNKILKHLYESIEMSYQTGNIPVLALDGIENENLVVMRESDLIKVLVEEIKIPEHSESKGIEKRKTAEIPLMLR